MAKNSDRFIYTAAAKWVNGRFLIVLHICFFYIQHIWLHFALKIAIFSIKLLFFSFFNESKDDEKKLRRMIYRRNLHWIMYDLIKCIQHWSSLTNRKWKINAHEQRIENKWLCRNLFLRWIDRQPFFLLLKPEEAHANRVCTAWNS